MWGGGCLEACSRASFGVLRVGSAPAARSFACPPWDTMQGLEACTCHAPTVMSATSRSMPRRESCGCQCLFWWLRYEDGEGKARGTGMVLQLACSVGNLEASTQRQASGHTRRGIPVGGTPVGGKRWGKRWGKCWGTPVAASAWASVGVSFGIPVGASVGASAGSAPAHRRPYHQLRRLRWLQCFYLCCIPVCPHQHHHDHHNHYPSSPPRQALIQNSSLMALLSRLLDTEHKRDLLMTFNVVRIFLAFSAFVEMHALLSQYKAGALTMKVRPSPLAQPLA